MSYERIKCCRCECQSPFVTNYRRNWFCDECASKNEILFEGALVKIDPDGEICPGDLYLARRNTGWKLLTCRKNVKNEGFIAPQENAYCFDTHECYKVVSI